MSLIGRMTGNLSGSAGLTNASVNSDGLVSALRQWWGMAHPDLEKTMKDEVGLLAKALIIFTPPFAPGGGGGLSRAAFNNSKRRIYRETEIVFKPLWKIPSVEIAKRDDFAIFQAVRKMKIRKRNEPGGARGPVMQSFYRDKDPLNGFLRMQRMFKNKSPSPNTERRVINSASYGLRGNQRVRGRITGEKKITYFVEQEDSIKASAEPAIARIGRMKSGWNDAAFAITSKPVTDVPDWISRHSGTGTGLNNLSNTFEPSAELRNFKGNIWNLADYFNTVQKAFDLREKNLQKKIKSYLAEQVRRRPFISPSSSNP